MRALAEVKALLGPGGYRVYAEALGRAPTTFHASVSNGTTLTSRLVVLSCQQLKQAQLCGESAERILLQSAHAFFPSLDDRSGLQCALETCLGADACGLLEASLEMSPAALRNAVSRSEARYHPHFRVIATAMLALRRHGFRPQLEVARSATVRCA